MNRDEAKERGYCLKAVEEGAPELKAMVEEMEEMVQRAKKFAEFRTFRCGRGMSHWQLFWRDCKRRGFWTALQWQMEELWNALVTWRLRRRLLGKGPVRVSGETWELLKKGEGKYFHATPEE